jgi:1,4-dihydroxy-2-naphthoate polyprenyltransferase
VQAMTVGPAAWSAAVPVGALGTALLVVNNLRDAATDVKAGKRTLVVRWGTTAGKVEYALLLALAYATPLGMWALDQASPGVFLAWLSAPLAVPLLRQVWGQRGAALNPTLGGTARLQLVFGVLFSVGLWWR